MVRGNWQKRVETAQARRKETRQKKLRRESRAIYKTLVQNQLWDFLDHFVDAVQAPGGSNKNNFDDLSIHVWTDIAPNFVSINQPHELAYQSDQDMQRNDDVFQSKSPIVRNSSSKINHTPKSSKSRRHSFDETVTSPTLMNIHKDDDSRNRDNFIKRASKGRRNSFDETGKVSIAIGKQSFKSSRHNSFDETDFSESPQTYWRANMEPTASSHIESSIARLTPAHDTLEAHIELPDVDSYLCRKFFFQDNCPHVAKKGSGCTCLYEHYPKNSNQKSLAQVLQSDIKLMQNIDTFNKIRQALESSSKASAIALSELDDLIYDKDHDTGDGHIDMLYYISFPHRTLKHMNIDSRPSLAHLKSDAVVDCFFVPESTKVSRALSQALSQEKCPIGSIVYLTVGTTLIFDRYNGGIVASLPTADKSTAYAKVSPATRIPDSILEYIILFLPNNASGILPSVCKTWYNEIGTNSPALWKSLIERNKWPSIQLNMKDNKSGDTVYSSFELRTKLRNLFISHYTVVKNMATLFAEVRKIDAPRTHSIKKLHQSNCLSFSYSDRTESQSSCVEILPFSESSILVAYQNCAVRLFDVALTPSGVGRFLKQTLLVRVAPFGISKKTSSLLRGIAMDNHTILCSFSVYNAKRVDDPSSKCWLASVHREDLLCMNNSSSQDEINEAVNVYNIWQRVADYLPKIMDHAPDEFADYLISGGLTSSLHIKIGKDIVSLGGGRFIFLVVILDNADYDDDATTLATASILFSTAGPSIIWMEFLPPSLQAEWSHQFILCGMTSKSTTTVAIASSHGSNILLIQVDVRNGVICREISDESRIFRNPEVDAIPKRCGLVLAHEIILADIAPADNSWHLSFLSYSESTETTLTTLMIPDCISIRRIQHLAEYVIAEVIFFRTPHHPRGSFGFVIVHIPTRCELHRYCLEDFDPVEFSLWHRSIFTQNFSAFVLSKPAETEDSEVHVILSSSSIRNVVNKDHEVDVDAAKKKPKKSSQKNTKKDGFARGMSLRG